MLNKNPLRILMLHNRYDVRGGEDESTDAEAALLRRMGHMVELLEADNKVIGVEKSTARTALDSVWSADWHRRTDEVLRRERFDIVHVQNFFPLISPSVYYAASKNNVPVIQAVRNYRLICPAASLFRNEQYCDLCVSKTIKWPAIINRCYRNSALGSVAIATMTGTHSFAGTWRSKVSKFVAISNFVKDRLIDGGYSADNIVVKPNFANVTGGYDNTASKDFILYVGRVTREKGAHLLLDAYIRSGTSLPLKIIGSGDLGAVADLPRSVTFLGKLPLDKVYAEMRNALCVVMPGAWPEPFGRVAVEAFGNRTAVIATDVAGCREIVEHGRTGLLFPAGDIERLSILLNRLEDSRETLIQMGNVAQEVWSDKYSPAANSSLLDKIYSDAIHVGNQA